MSDTPNEFETVDDEQEPGKLRQLLKQAHAQLKQKDKELTELRTVESQRAAKATWDELKVPAKIRALYNGEKDPAAMKQWWDEYREVFNVEVAEEQPVEPQPTPEEQAQQQAAQQFQDASTLGTNAIHSGFDAIKQEAANVAASFKAGRMSRADYDAAVTKLNESMNTPAY